MDENVNWMDQHMYSDKKMFWSLGSPFLRVYLNPNSLITFFLNVHIGKKKKKNSFFMHIMYTNASNNTPFYTCIS